MAKTIFLFCLAALLFSKPCYCEDEEFKSMILTRIQKLESMILTRIQKLEKTDAVKTARIAYLEGCIEDLRIENLKQNKKPY